ncbi:GGDEF domain-containing protein [Oceanicoccus sp. KOV_DT_Chl]|uniref:GGDEF domain-containing protein n=1 Tax=Oceanicoccus sp. KOV_DT_Chl TaxID=1904639 RepID=UPI000C7B035F|nr:GGDEF domain-containing protein [Oceanicoccus sp. KOV_DT_Chl]
MLNTHFQHAALFAPLDFFAKPHFADDSLQLARARALVGTNLFITFVLTLGILFILSVDSVGDLGSLFIGGLLLPGIVLNITLPFVLQKTGWLMLCQQTTLIITFIAIVIGICSSGGPVHASNNQLMILQAALSLFLLGIRGGLIWSALVLMTQVSLYYLFFNGFDFPNLQPAAATTAGAIFNWTLAFLAIISLILLTELSRGQLEVQRHIEKEKFRYLATHDGLTQLANRRLFEDKLKQAIEQSQKNNTKVLLLYIDLDKFKPINDQWGHDVGDQVLQVIAARLKTATRERDTTARLGGDEFAVLLPDLEKNASINKLTESLYERITQPINLHGRFFDIGCSIGICSYPEYADSSAQLWKQADAAMYIAKKKSVRWHIHKEKHHNVVELRP